MKSTFVSVIALKRLATFSDSVFCSGTTRVGTVALGLSRRNVESKFSPLHRSTALRSSSSCPYPFSSLNEGDEREI